MDLVQILPATPTSVKRATGSLPPQLTDPKRRLYSRAMKAIDKVEEGLKTGDRSLVIRGHSVIRSTGQTIKRQLCEKYYYPAPDPLFPDNWDVLCSSGESGLYNRPPQECLNCLFFDNSNHPNFAPAEPGL